MRVFLTLVEVVLKCVIGMITGGGVGTLVFGIGLVMEGTADFNRLGPPPGPVFIGLGAGLLTAAFTMLVLFVGPFSRRWFVTTDTEDEKQPKWKS